jgi:hypothetical protein
MAWFTSLTTEKQEVINVGTIAVLLIIKRRDKATLISLISPSADRCPNTCKSQASNGISLSLPMYISKLGSTKFISCGVIDKEVTTKFEITFISKDLK